MGVNPTSMAELHFPEVIIDIALFSSRTSSFFKYWGRPLTVFAFFFENLFIYNFNTYTT